MYNHSTRVLYTYNLLHYFSIFSPLCTPKYVGAIRYYKHESIAHSVADMFYAYEHLNIE